MKFQEYGDEFLLDDFPKIYNPTQKIFLTHLSAQLILPKIIPKIYTTKTLATQFIIYLNSKGFTDIDLDHFVILEPFQPYKLRCNDGSLMKILVCESNDISRNLLILFYKDRKVTHLYGGMLTDIRTVVLNNTFVEWIKHGVNKLYLNLKKATEICDPRALINAVAQVEHIINTIESTRVLICIPIFGYENFIYKLGEKYRKRITIDGTLHQLYQKLGNMDFFEPTDMSEAKIVLTSQEQTMEKIQNNHLNKIVTIKIVEGTPIYDEIISNFGYYEVQWSPLPTPFDLELLTNVSRPVKIVPIVKSYGGNIRIPSYLLDLCLRQRTQIYTKISHYKKHKSNESTTVDKPRTQPKTKVITNESVSPNAKTPTIFHIRKQNLCYLEGDSDSNK